MASIGDDNISTAGCWQQAHAGTASAVIARLAIGPQSKLTWSSPTPVLACTGCASDDAIDNKTLCKRDMDSITNQVCKMCSDLHVEGTPRVSSTSPTLRGFQPALQVIDAEMGRRKLLEDAPVASINDDPVNFDTDEIPWWAWVQRFHLPEVS